MPGGELAGAGGQLCPGVEDTSGTVLDLVKLVSGDG